MAHYASVSIQRIHCRKTSRQHPVFRTRVSDHLPAWKAATHQHRSRIIPVVLGLVWSAANESSNTAARRLFVRIEVQGRRAARRASSSPGHFRELWAHGIVPMRLRDTPTRAVFLEPHVPHVSRHARLQIETCRGKPPECRQYSVPNTDPRATFRPVSLPASARPQGCGPPLDGEAANRSQQTGLP